MKELAGSEVQPSGTLPDSLSREFVTAVLSDLVRTPSVNPGTPELAVAERIAEWLAPTGAEVHMIETFPGRPSVAAVMDGGLPGPTLVLNGHMDTVPVDDAERWTTDPFGAEEREGFLYGRGACDMKGGLAAQIAVAHAMAARAEQLKGRLVLHFAAGEECGEPGTMSLCEAGFVGDVGIVTEPTGLRVSVATRGRLSLRIRILGRSVHAGAAEMGHNPVDHLQDVLRVLREHSDAISATTHPLLGSGSCTPTVIRAGVNENAVADYCDVHVDRRLLPGEEIDDEMSAIAARLDQLVRGDSSFRYELDSSPYPFAPAEIPKDSVFAGVVQAMGGEVIGSPPAIIGTAFSSDVRNLVNDWGIEAVTFGPGNVAECHCVDERIALDEVVLCARVIARVAEQIRTS